MSSLPAPRIAIIYYSMYGHIAKMADAVKTGIESKGGQATVYQIQETLTPEVLNSMQAEAKASETEAIGNGGLAVPPIATPETLTKYDAFIFGVPTRYGNMSAQWKAFWDHTGRLWKTGALAGKYAGVFVSTGSPGGGQEMTVASMMSTLVHQGIIFVPLGYASGLMKLIEANTDEVHGGSPWGAGSFAIARRNDLPSPSQLELEIAKVQGSAFFETVKRVDFRSPNKPSSEQ